MSRHEFCSAHPAHCDAQVEAWDEDDKNQQSPKCDRLGAAQVPWKKLWRDEVAEGEGPAREHAMYLKVYKK
jgi:hypothetical protein